METNHMIKIIYVLKAVLENMQHQYTGVDINVKINANMKQILKA